MLRAANQNRYDCRWQSYFKVVFPVRKNLSLKTAKHSKARDFTARQEKKPWQGWRLPWFFCAVLREKIRFGAYKSLCAPAFTRGIYFLPKSSKSTVLFVIFCQNSWNRSPLFPFAWQKTEHILFYSLYRLTMRKSGTYTFWLSFHRLVYLPEGVLYPCAKAVF